MNLLLTQCHLRHRWSTGLWKIPALFEAKCHQCRPPIRNITGQTKVLKSSHGKHIRKLLEAPEMLFSIGQSKKYISYKSIGRTRMTFISWFGLISVCTGLIVGFILMVRPDPVDNAARVQISDMSNNAEMPRSTNDGQENCTCKEETPEDNTEADKTDETCKTTVSPQVTEREDILHEKLHYFGQFLEETMRENKIPGLSVAVSVNGEIVERRGFGVANIENDVPCTDRTVFNIGGITRAITMAAVAKLWEEGKLDIDKPVQHYVPEFPMKYRNNKKVILTTRHLINDLGGIRHSMDHGNKNQNATVIDGHNSHRYTPGQDTVFSNRCWNLVGVVVERASKTPFKEYINKILQNLGMTRTCFAVYEDIVPNRTRMYMAGEELDNIVHASYVDFSHLMPAEGLSSNVLDLVKFGNAMLSSYMTPEGSDAKPQFLSAKTMAQMWPTKDLLGDREDVQRKMGWKVEEPKKNTFVAFQLGENLGVFGVLLVIPPYTNPCSSDESECSTPKLSQGKGVVISILANNKPDEIDFEKMFSFAYEFSQTDKRFEQCSKSLES